MLDMFIDNKYYSGSEGSTKETRLISLNIAPIYLSTTTSEKIIGMLAGDVFGFPEPL